MAGTIKNGTVAIEADEMWGKIVQSLHLIAMVHYLITQNSVESV